MKRIKFIALILAAISLTACNKKELDQDQLTKVGNAGRTFFSAQSAGGKQGQFLSCSGLDSDNDGNVTCTGQVPNNEGNMIFQEALCSFGAAAGCKRK
jgi:hypothetical protein